MAVDVQPLVGLVTVNVYAPAVPIDGFCEVDVKLLGPVQLYVTPEVLELPESVTEVAVQLNGPLLEAVAPGAVVFAFTVAVAVEIHPLEGLVTVSVYVPAVLTEGFCVVELKLPGPDQL